MNLRDEVFSHSQPLWVLCVDSQSIDERLSPLQATIDWYNNHLLEKNLISNKIDTSLGARTLLATSGLLPVKRLLVFGLGNSGSLTAAQARKAIEALSSTLVELQEVSPWIILPARTPPKIVEEFEKSRTSADPLKHASISAG